MWRRTTKSQEIESILKVFNFEGVYAGERAGNNKDCRQSKGQRGGKEEKAWRKSQKENRKEEGIRAQGETKNKTRSFCKSTYQERISVCHTIDETSSIKLRRFVCMLCIGWQNISFNKVQMMQIIELMELLLVALWDKW
jgi:hypothetical protein